ncbi:MAG: DUF4097 family beta strand repeat-containing protein [bacterium]
MRRRRPGWFGWRRSPRVRVEVDALRRSDVDARNDDGRLTVSGFDGRLTLTVDDGTLIVSDTSGELRATSEDGDLELLAHAGSSMEDNWAIHADDGDISLVLPDDFAADLRLSSDDGPIEVEPPVAVRGRVSRHRLSGQLNGGGPELRVRSDGGHITIRR